MQTIAPESLAVRRRRESRREEWTEHIKLAELLEKYVDPSCTFWTSLENKPLTVISGIFQKRRGVRSGLPDVLVIFSRKPIFLELKSRRGLASKVQKQVVGGAVFRSDATLAAASEGGGRAPGGKAALSAAERDARERGRGASTATN
jgi:hypothetical protein